MNDDIQNLRRQLRQLRELHEGGALGAAQYEESRAAIERRLVDLVMADAAAAPAVAASAPTSVPVTSPVTPSVTPSVTPRAATPAAAPPAARASGRLLGALAVVVLLVAVAGYWFTGAPDQAGLIAASPAPAADTASAGQPHATGTEQIAAMVDKLAQRMKENPDDAEGWAMLGRSYAVLGRHDDAVPAYQKAVALRADDPVLLADYADALAVRNDRRLDGEPMKLIERALKLDPKNLKALSLAGTAAFDRQDYAAAVKHWETIVQVAPPDSSYLAQVRSSIDEARELGKLPPSTLAPPAAAGAAGAVNASVSGTVSLAAGLAKKADPGDTVFVFARAAEGSRMPLAILKKQVRDLPITFTLDDSMAMSPAARLSGAGQVVVGARVSRSGQATPSPGDLSGLSAPVAVGTSGLKIEIADEVRP